MSDIRYLAVKLISINSCWRFKKELRMQDLTTRSLWRVQSLIGSFHGASRSILHYPGMWKLIVAFITNAPARCYVLLGWTGKIMSTIWHSLMWLPTLTGPRVKEKLKAGELMVSGDQWPVLLYSGYSYDAEDPWNGLFRSTILVSVRHLEYLCFTMSDDDILGL